MKDNHNVKERLFYTLKRRIEGTSRRNRYIFRKTTVWFYTDMEK